MDVRLITVETGPLWKMQLLQGKLEEEGVPSFIPDENTKRVDPFITGGGNVLDVSLQVPEELAEKTMAFLAHYKEVAEEPDKDAPPPHPTTGFAEETQRGRRFRWLALSIIILGPLGLLLGIAYILNLKSDEPRPRSHALTIIAIFLSMLVTVGYILLFTR